MSNHEETLVLVADDEPSTLALVTAHLRSKTGFKVVEASDGDMAWQLAHEHLPDLVILDVMMPGMSGWEVCRKIRESLPLAHTGVIMLTGIGENLNEMTSPLYGADAHVDKPFEFADLDEKIEATLETRRAGAFGRADHADEVAARDEDDDSVPAVTQPSPPLSNDSAGKAKPARGKGKQKGAPALAAAKAEEAPPAVAQKKGKKGSAGQLEMGIGKEPAPANKRKASRGGAPAAASELIEAVKAPAKKAVTPPPAKAKTASKPVASKKASSKKKTAAKASSKPVASKKASSKKAGAKKSAAKAAKPSASKTSPKKPRKKASKKAGKKRG
jgi:CheY-like chemotaxis protein